MGKHCEDFTQAKIYQIVDTRTQEVIYVGKTCLTLRQRWAAHQSSSKRCKSAVYIWIRGNGGVRHFDIQLIEPFPCICNKDLRVREDHWLRQLNPKQNTQGFIRNRFKPGRCDCGMVLKSTYPCHIATHMRGTRCDVIVSIRNLWQ